LKNENPIAEKMAGGGLLRSYEKVLIGGGGSRRKETGKLE